VGGVRRRHSLRTRNVVFRKAESRVFMSGCSCRGIRGGVTDQREGVGMYSEVRVHDVFESGNVEPSHARLFQEFIRKERGKMLG